MSAALRQAWRVPLQPVLTEPPPPPSPRSLCSLLSLSLSLSRNFTWEILIVDDGSKDSTAQIALSEYVAKAGSEHVRLLKLFKNGGKGAAVRKGVMRTRGKYILMADADGATKFSDVDALLAAARKLEKRSSSSKKGGSSSALSFAIGSRAHMAQKRDPLRKLLMMGFHALIQLLLGGSGIEDTQCGFKLFSRAAAAKLFPVLHIERWAFDVELVFLAGRKGVPMAEVPVTWHEVAGSKLDPASATIQMARDIIVIRLAYLTGLWKE